VTTTIYGENDHVYLLVAYPPKAAVSNLVNPLKGVPGRLPRKERARHPETLLERRSVVAVLLRRILRWRTGFHRAPAHRATANATLSAAKDACGVRAILPRPERRGLPRTGSIPTGGE